MTRHSLKKDGRYLKGNCFFGFEHLSIAQHSSAIAKRMQSSILGFRLLRRVR